MLLKVSDHATGSLACPAGTKTGTEHTDGSDMKGQALKWNEKRSLLH